MKNKEIIELYKGLKKVEGYKGVNFNFAIAKNLSSLEKEFEILSKEEERVMKITEEFQKERKVILEKFCKKNEDGTLKFITENKMSIYDIDKEILKTEVKKEIDSLKETHKEKIESQEKEFTDFEELLEKENDSYKPFEIKMEVIPEDISTEHMKILFNIIKE